ncbi:MAG: hypothetical protein V4568_19650 [Pseudomonadota bacterium]
MKENTLHSLVIARTLLERSAPLCASEDKYLASAGLVVLQDALEAVFYALLIELGIDEEKNLERKSFDDLIGELKAANISIPKSGTLKALNKQRVLTKHYAQVAEPTTVRTYFEAAQTAIEATCKKVLGKSIRDLFIADILTDGEAKSYLKKAEVAISEKRFLDALTEIRKAIFIEFEEQYSIYEWRNDDGKVPINGLRYFMRRGWRAPSYTRNRDWIEKNVKVPTDFIQVDYEDLRFRAMEIGIHTVELENLQRLTPQVFQTEQKAEWSVTYDVGFPSNSANEANAHYCLDRAVWIILKKQEHAGARREPKKDAPFDPPPVYIDHAVFEQPSTQSDKIHFVSTNFKYTIHRIVSGFNPSEKFYEISAISEEHSKSHRFDEATYYRGFLQVISE